MTVSPATLGAIHARFAGGDAAGAWAQLEPQLRAGGGDGKALQLAGMIRRGLGDLPGARDWLERSAAAGGGGEALNMLGNVLADLGDPDAADAAFARAVEAAPGDPNPWINRGRLASRQGRHGPAETYLREAVALAPRSVVASVALGNALRTAGDVEAAVTELTRARDLEPGRASTGVHLGVALTAADRPAEAIGVLDAAERGGDRSPGLAHNRAAAYLALGEVAEAQAEYERLVTRHPTYLEGHKEYARVHQEFALPGDPFASYRRLVAQHPREPAVWNAWLEAVLAARDHALAVDVADRGLRAVGDLPTLKLGRAIALSETGRRGEANAAFANLPDSAQPAQLIAHARHLLRIGDPMAAATLCGRALAADPDDQAAWAYLGTAWRLTDDPREHWLHDYDRQVAIVPAAADPAFLADAAATLRALHVTRHHPGDQSLRNGTQTAGDLFARREPAIRAIAAAAQAAVMAFVSGLPDDDRHPLLRRKSRDIRFAGAWSVRLSRDGYHINHVHSAGWISSAFYFVLPGDDLGDEGALQLGSPPVELGFDLAPRRVIRPQVGQLILFPSSMWHGTIPFTREGERLTVAFDVVPA